MEYVAILTAIIKGVQIAVAAAPVLIEALPKLKDDIEAAFLSHTGKSELSPEERTLLDSEIESLSARLHTPLTPV